MKTQTRYKFLRTGTKSNHGDMKWRLNKWYKHNGDISLCNSGYHCSKGIYQAFSYVQGEILGLVEVRGVHKAEDDKEVWSEMRVIKRWKWQRIDGVLFSIYAARLCLDSFESVFPDDKRPREAIDAAETYIKNPTEKNRKAAESAAWSAWSAESAARSAESAARSARSAARSARSAAESAESAAESAESAAESAESAARSAESAAESAAWSARSAESAAWSAESAAWSARSAAWSAWSAESAARSAESAARSAVYKKLDKWMLNHLAELKEI